MRRRTGKAERRNPTTRGSVPRLLFQLRKVDRPTVDAGRRAGFEPSLRKLQFLEPCGQRHRRRIPRASCGVAVKSDVHLAIQKSPGRQNDRLGIEANAHLRNNPGHPVTVDQQVVARRLKQPQIRLMFQAPPHRGSVKHAIRLSTGSAHSRTLGAVQDLEVNTGFVRSPSHGAAQCIDLFDEVSLADPTDGRVAAHLPEGLEAMGEQQCCRAHAGRRQRGLGAGVATTDHDHIETLGEEHGTACLDNAIAIVGSRVLRTAIEVAHQRLPSEARSAGRSISRCGMPSSSYGVPTGSKPNSR